MIIWEQLPFVEKAKSFAYTVANFFLTGVDLEDKNAQSPRKEFRFGQSPKGAPTVKHYLRSPGW